MAETAQVAFKRALSLHPTGNTCVIAITAGNISTTTTTTHSKTATTSPIAAATAAAAAATATTTTTTTTTFTDQLKSYIGI